MDTQMLKTAKLIGVLTKWSAPTLLFELNPKYNDNQFIIIAAANAIQRYEMIIYTCDVINGKYSNIKFGLKDYTSLKCNLPLFKKTLESIGYNMVGEIPRSSKEIIKKAK